MAKKVPAGPNQELKHLKCPSKVCKSVELMEASDLPRNCWTDSFMKSGAVNTFT